MTSKLLKVKCNHKFETCKIERFVIFTNRRMQMFLMDRDLFTLLQKLIIWCVATINSWKFLTMGSLNFSGMTFLVNIHIIGTWLNRLPLIALRNTGIWLLQLLAELWVSKAFPWRCFLILVRKCEGWKFLMNYWFMSSHQLQQID